MNARRALIWSLALMAGVASTMIGCGGPGTTRVVPAGIGSSSTSDSTAGERSLDAAVVRSQAGVAGTVAYGVINGPWQAPPIKAGLVLLDGEDVLPPPDDSLPSEAAPTSAAPNAAASPSCSSFNGNVPPPCTNTGVFRRVYSGPNYSYALARITLPAQAGMQNILENHGDAGFIYFEGWPVANKAFPTELGFQYSPVKNYYTPYFRTSLPSAYGYATYKLNNYVHYTAGQTVTLALAGYTIAGAPYLHVAVLGTVTGSCTVAGGTTQTNMCLAHGHFADTNWTPSTCCIMARMTTIAQTPPNVAFYDAANFGPIIWSGAELAQTAPTPAPGSTLLPITANQPAWTGGGSQNWPPQLNKIIVSDQTPTGESDTIDLKPLPDLKLSLKPATCQHMKGTSGTLGSTVTLSGDPAGLTLAYGWENPILGPPAKGETVDFTVPGSTPETGMAPPGADPQTVEHIGKNSTSATLSVKLPGTSGSGAFPIVADLYFIDPTGKLTADWNGNRVSAGNLFTLDNYPCPGN